MTMIADETAESTGVTTTSPKTVRAKVRFRVIRRRKTSAERLKAINAEITANYPRVMEYATANTIKLAGRAHI